MSLSQKLANYIHSTTYDDLPKNVVSFTNLCVLDYFGSALAGASKSPVKMIDELVKEMGGKQHASLVTGGKSSTINAAFVNGAASHIVELDDIHKSSIIHAATVVIPAALAVAEFKKRTGKELITAIVAGYEVCYRIGEAVSPSHYYYWHNTATCGTFGAAAAAAKMLDLGEGQIIHALGNAGTQAAGLWEFIEDGAMTKQLHPGKAAMNGVISALLAKKGFTGAQKILEGNRGFFKAMSDDYQAEKITAGLGDQYKIMENSFKIHASCRHTHPAMDLMISLKNERSINIDEINQINVQTYQVGYNITNNDQPDSEYASKFSLQFCTALALINGKGGSEQFNNQTLWENGIRELMKRVNVQVSSEIDQFYPEKWGTSVEVYMKSGEVIKRSTDFPKGDPENPVSVDELVNKFMNLARSIPENERMGFVHKVLHLETIDSIRGLMESISYGK
ncbi:MmgE/PrpD family protein [Lentibacillus sp. L22]|uniref:MmgE/PrpD family protein n=1 Tax=Lentibacillus sp. L22 TaxID=3163028 RepID=UPI00346734FC